MDTFQPEKPVSAPVASGLVENVTYDEITIGQTASLSRVLDHKDIELFARVSGDTNPAHLDAAYAARRSSRV